MRSSLVAAVIGGALAACAATAPPPSTAPPASTGPGSPSPVPTATDASPSPSPSPTPTDIPASLDARRISEAVTEAALQEHLAALQAIADANGGSRATGTAGFDASVAYVEMTLESAGYRVERQAFDASGVPSANVVVERPGATTDEVVMLGAHVDSVAAGPGINDDGSGVAALLVIAMRVAELPAPHRTIRFAFWGAEEGGPFGSAAYVGSLGPDERDPIVAYLNFDMIGSPNAVRFVYSEPGAAHGSAAITQAFAAALESAGRTWEPIDLDGDSDHGPFTGAGIPTGGLFSGGIEPVTDGQAATFGAVAGQPADPCSHRACDTIDNVDLATLEEMTDAIAEVLVGLARSGG
jgi:aminopeptidase S